MLTAEINQALQSANLIITVGNDLRSDDGLGPYISANAKDLRAGLKLANLGNRPEDFLALGEELGKAKKVLFIDAANFSGRPGEGRLFAAKDLTDKIFSTHTFPIKAIARMIEQDYNVEVQILAVQGASFQLGEKMSAEVIKTAKEILACMSSTC